jgi:AcrR family transcriptional regulator
MTVLDTTRDRLLTAAGEVFAEKGFKAATVREIIRRAGVNIAAVNYYYGDKERLYIESVKYAHCRVVQDLLSNQWPPATPPAEKLRAFICRFVARLLDPARPAWHSNLMMREIAQPTSACAELVRDNIRPVAQMLMGILNELLPDPLPRWKRFMIGFSIISQCLHYCQNKPINVLLVGEEDYQRHFDAATLAEHITDFTLAAFGLRAPLTKQELQS